MPPGLEPFGRSAFPLGRFRIQHMPYACLKVLIYGSIFFATISSLIGVLVKNFASRLNELGIAIPHCVFEHFKSRPDLLKAFALFIGLYFKASIRAHECLN